MDLEETAATKQLKKLQIHSVKITRGHRTSDKHTKKPKSYIGEQRHTLLDLYSHIGSLFRRKIAKLGVHKISTF